MGTPSLEKILEVCSDLAELPAKGEEGSPGKVIAHTLPDVPEEIIHAAGFFPLPILGCDRRISLSEGRLPNFLCSLVRGPLEMALNGSLDFIAGMVIPYVCDSTRAFSQVWESTRPHLFNHALWLPKKHDGEPVKAFLLAEFNRLKRGLEALSGRRIEDGALQRSIALYNRNRSLLRLLFRLAKTGETPLTYGVFLSLVKAMMMLPKEKGNELLLEVLEDMKARSGSPPQEKRPKIFLLGALCDSSSIFDMVEQAGMQVVDDNLYNGTRYFLQDAPESGDPMEALVDRHLSKDPLGTYLFSEEQWSDYLLKRLGQGRVQGLIYLYPKYCDPMEFDFPFFRDKLRSIGIPVLPLEMDLPSASEAQMKTRLEAFSEILRGDL